MVFALGAALSALDAIQSLTSPRPSSSSKPIGGFGAVSDAEDRSAVSSASTTVSGFSSAQISSDNISALLDAQSLASANLSEAIDANSPTSDSSSTRPNSASGTASSTYSSIDQLIQSTTAPLGFNPFSISI
jgi:hypothetical protein